MEEIVSYLHASTSRAKRHYFRVADLDPQNVILAATIYSFYLHVLRSTSLTIIVQSEHLNIARTSATSSLHIRYNDCSECFAKCEHAKKCSYSVHAQKKTLERELSFGDDEAWHGYKQTPRTPSIARKMR